jgi:hypothetical protein
MQPVDKMEYVKCKLVNDTINIQVIMRSMDFSFDIIIPVAIWPSEWLCL